MFAVKDSLMVALPDQHTLETLGYTLQDIKALDLPVPPQSPESMRGPSPADMMAIYFKHAGARLIKTPSSPTVYASNEGKRMGLRSPEWVSLLGFKPEDIQVVKEDDVETLVDDGATPALPNR